MHQHTEENNNHGKNVVLTLVVMRRKSFVTVMWPASEVDGTDGREFSVMLVISVVGSLDRCTIMNLCRYSSATKPKWEIRDTRDKISTHQASSVRNWNNVTPVSRKLTYCHADRNNVKPTLARLCLQLRTIIECSAMQQAITWTDVDL